MEESRAAKLSKKRTEEASDSVCMGAEDKLIVMLFAVKKIIACTEASPSASSNMPQQRNYVSYLMLCSVSYFPLIIILIVHCMLLSSSQPRTSLFHMADNFGLTSNFSIMVISLGTWEQ